METIILLHGALGTEGDLRFIANHLSLKFHVRLFNFSGHGQENFSESFGIDTFAAELKNYILKNDLGGASVFGYSMGGYVALRTAAENPALIRRIVTFATKFNWTQEIIEKEAANCDPEKIQQKVPAFAASLQKSHKDWHSLIKATAGMIENFGSKDLPDPFLKKINIPVLLLVGENDKLVSVEETERVANILPVATMEALPNAGHLLPSVPPQLLADLITKFVSTD